MLGGGGRRTGVEGEDCVSRGREEDWCRGGGLGRRGGLM